VTAGPVLAPSTPKAPSTPATRATFIGERGLPVQVRPEHLGVDGTPAALLGWLQSGGAARVRATSERGGAVLLRGFAVTEPDVFSAVVQAVDPSVRPYEGGATDRDAVGDAVYEASRYPASHHLPLHSETCYLRRFPHRLFFACPQVAKRGGETTLADNRRILAELPDAVARRFRAHGVRYVRNVLSERSKTRLKITRAVGSSAVQSWEEMFQTDDRAAVEAHCLREGMAFAWRDDGGLCLSDTLPATRIHPVTEEEVWFNQAHIFHVGPSRFGALYPIARLLNGGGDDALYGATYGDGSPIPEADVKAVRTTLRASEVPHAWERGDVLVVDNLLCSHGRRPFKGARSVWFAQAVAPH
jgi:alpha-ketoglutarate-dependent taurine dioxygenase